MCCAVRRRGGVLERATMSTWAFVRGDRRRVYANKRRETYKIRLYNVELCTIRVRRPPQWKGRQAGRKDIKLPMELKIKCMFVESNSIMNIIRWWSNGVMWWVDSVLMGREIEKDLLCSVYEYVVRTLHEGRAVTAWHRRETERQKMGWVSIKSLKKIMRATLKLSVFTQTRSSQNLTFKDVRTR